MAAKEALNLMRDLRHNIQHFLNEANFAAESAADDLFNDQFSSCALEKIDELNALLKQCREKFNSVRNIIIDSLEPVRLLSEQEIEVSSIKPRQQNLSISTAEVSFGQPLAVELLSGGSPANFWLRLTNTSVEELEKKLALSYSSSVSAVNILPNIGSFVICLCDTIFCRGKVANILNKKRKVQIVLVDYGSIVIVSVNQIYPIQEQFCSEPAIGLCCSVHELDPLNEGWDIKNVIEFFLPHCQSSHLFATFHPFQESESRGETFISLQYADFAVSLETREPSGNGVVDIGRLMTQIGLARSSLVTKPSPVVDSAHSDDSPSAEIAIDIPVCKLGDEGIMNKFLNSFEMPLRQKTVGVKNSTSCITSPSKDSSHSSTDSSSVTAWRVEPYSTSLKLDYQFGAVLEHRTSPFRDKNSSDSCTIKFLFSYIFSPSYFCVHLSEEISTRVEPLILRLNAVYESAPLIPVTTKPEIGSFWVTKEVEKVIWSRVEVIDVDYVKRSATVVFVDWGYIEIVDFSQLQPLVKEFVDIPCLAFRCRLGGVFPYLKTWDCLDWPEEATVKFVSLCKRDTEMTALVSSCVEEEGSLSIIMLYDGNENCYSINELLVHSKFASTDVFVSNGIENGIDSSRDNENEPMTRDMPEWNPMAEDFYSPANTAALDTENYDSVTTGYIPKDENTICRFFRANGTCYKGIKCDQLHCNPIHPNVTQDRMEVCIDVPELPLPTPGMYISIQVTVVLNSSRFYCVLPHGMKNVENRFKEDDEETLETLQAAMQREYSDNYYRHRITLNPSAGDIVIAKSSEDNMWYRGRVMLEEEDDKFTIFYVDFGNCESVHLRNLCSMLPRFNHLPAQAVGMFLNGVKTKGNSTAGRDLLVQLVKNKDLVAQVIHTLPYITVDLYDTTGSKEVDIAQELISRRVVEAGHRKKFCMQSRRKVVPG